MDTYGNIYGSWAHGYTGQNIHHVDPEVLCYACGSHVKFTNTTNKQEKVFKSPGNGISALTASAAKKLLAVAEACLDPKIFVCESSTMDVTKVLSGGATIEYKMLSFSPTKTYLAAYSDVPDFSLSIWDYSTGELLCRHQVSLDSEPTSMSFDPLNWHNISICGPQDVRIFYIEKCNQDYAIKERIIVLPQADGKETKADHDHSGETVPGFHFGLTPAVTAGLVGESARNFKPSSERRELMKPTSHCWTSKGLLYVGCKGGQLFSVETSSGSIGILLASSLGNVVPGMFNTLSLNTQGLYAGGSDGVLRMLRLEKNGIQITTAFEGASEISTADFSPFTFSELVLGSASGELLVYNCKHGNCRMLLAEHYGQFIGVAYADAGNLCATCRQDGTVQLWDAELGNLISDISVGADTQATAFASCPSSSVVAVGTSSGHIYYVDVCDPMKPRTINRQRIHEGPVNYIKYNPLGTYLLSSSSEENHIFVVDSRPSGGFACIGSIDCKGCIKDMTVVQHTNDTAHVAVVVIPDIVKQEQDGENDSEDENLLSDRLIIFSIPNKLMEKLDVAYASLDKNFKDEFINRLTFDLTVPLDSAVVTGVDKYIHVVALGQVSKSLLQFKFSHENDDSTTLHNPSHEIHGHELTGGSVVLSPHGQWLMTFSEDGCFTVRDKNSMESAMVVKAHSFLCGGVLMAAFSPDGQSIVSIGKEDASLVSYSWELQSKGHNAMNAAIESARKLDMQLRSISEKEDAILSSLGDWSPAAETDRQENQAVSEESTWYAEQLANAHEQENLKYVGVKAELLTTIKDLRTTVLQMIAENSGRPEVEQLDHEEYNLDVEEQKRLEEAAEAKVQKVRDAIDYENLAQTYRRHIIEKQCWSDMALRGRAVKSFNSHITVTNYPVIEQESKESKLIDKVSRIRAIEAEDLSTRKQMLEVTKKPAGEEEEDEEDVTVNADAQMSLHGSLGPKYGGEVALYYSQFDLLTKQQKIRQILLVKGNIQKIKKTFNDAFSATYTNKEQEILRTKERNIRIREIMQDLDMDASDIKDPEMDSDENPENVLSVADEEVLVERVLSMEEEKRLVAEKKAEQARLEAAKSDNKRERGLIDMMGGVLEVKKEDILKQDLPSPEFMTEKLEKDWTDEERKAAKEHERQQKLLLEERDKYRKNLESELKKLQQGIAETTTAFDDQLLQLYNRKVKSDMVIRQEELKIVRLCYGILVHDEIANQESHLNCLLEITKEQKTHATKIGADVRTSVDDYREQYDSVVAEDKMLDRAFRRDFSDVPLALVDHLYKLFKRRPRVQRPHQQQEAVQTFNPYDNSGKMEVDVSSTALDLFKEIDDISNAPEGLEEPVWQRLCMSRKTKFESEQHMRNSAMTLAEMSQYLQRCQEECENLLSEVESVIKNQNKLSEERMKNNLNLDIQFLLKQGQVEVESSTFSLNYGDSVLIQRNVVEDLNGTIRGLGESKVAAMTECKDFKKGIHLLEWERKRMMMQMEDLHNRARHIQMLKLTKDLQLYLSEDNYQARQARQMAVLEQTSAIQEKNLEKNVNRKNCIIKDLKKHIKRKVLENDFLQRGTEELHVSVSERKNIDDVNALERAKNTADNRLKGIVQRRRLVDLAKAQAQEVAVLRAEVERLRMKTFPALVQVER